MVLVISYILVLLFLVANILLLSTFYYPRQMYTQLYLTNCIFISHLHYFTASFAKCYNISLSTLTSSDDIVFRSESSSNLLLSFDIYPPFINVTVTILCVDGRKDEFSGGRGLQNRFFQTKPFQNRPYIR